ncbi:unnamed protein product [Paramecium octaurelia]|uniref:Large ribosomal subunit protein uL4m n=1 Tax=Paramecium octaurelia TaxID=43137 RepID=A0A8S1TEN9_PAROT|nr:unnamed protein product [Paramecium octaurelia]
MLQQCLKIFRFSFAANTPSLATPWSLRPFKTEVSLPIIRFHDAQPTGQSIALDQEIFNQPIRRDLVQRLVRYTDLYDKKVTKATLALRDAAASGAKNHPQKKTGRARQGHRQRPGRNKGIKAHGRKIRSLRIDLPRKVRLQAYKVGLTAALIEGKFTVIDTEKLNEGKTKHLVQLMKGFESFTQPLLIVTSVDPDDLFLRASRNLENLETCTVREFNIIKILKFKSILITKEAIIQLTESLKQRKLTLLGDNKIVKKKYSEYPIEEYDPNKPLDLKFKVLREYLEDFEKLKKEGQLDKFIQDMPKTKKVGRINTINHH